ncbi:iron complex outermembrane recepter protein [Arachidicoccus rhizosphaerae]|uniref:Iron complex outermembrane recepter protein n=1 Tax=Arachidicoccus rhizosphaerae TaxID=551991 RepID=A0A1H3YWL9_9BACT|nr:TonB-dependent receptor [Arachidicoccus rhizosphaerae]SEA15807.1 iron complex outermembrane recepter protein [Arachidicoccus rhizosphaerae]
MFYSKKNNLKLFLSLLCLLSSHIAISQKQISGQIISEEGHPIAAVSVHLIHQNIYTLSNQQGLFNLKILHPCKDTLVISAAGYKQNRHILLLNSSEDSFHLNIVLKDTTSPLKTVTVHTNLLPDNKSVFVARMPLKNLENPQVYNVISHTLIDQQQITTIDQAMQNVAGVVPNNSAGGYFSITSRGFTTYVNARNGTSVPSYFTSYEPSNLERIEVLKGPAGTLYQGAASYGGAVNLVTKRPEREPATRLSFTTGSWGLNRATLDYNHPLDSSKRFLFRMNAAADREKTFQDFGHSNIYSLSPSFSYTASEKWQIIAEFELYSSEKTPTPWQSFDSYYQSVKDVPLYKKSFYDDDMKSNLIRQNTTITSEYQLDKNWKSSTVIGALNSSVDHNYFAYNYYLSKDSIRRLVYDYDYNYSSVNIQQNFTGKFNLLGLKNKIVTGIEYVSTSFNYAGYSTNYDTANINNFTPIMRKKVDKFIAERPSFAAANTWTASRYAAYVSDLMYLSAQWMAMLSLRADHYHYTLNTPYSQTAFSPKLGIVYQPIKDEFSIFVNYTDGFSNQNTANKSDGSVVKLDPIHATQYEGGIKWDAPDQRYSATLSIYDIKIHNANLYDEQGFFNSQDGKQQSKGLELEFKASPTDKLNILLGYGYNENKYTKSSNYQGNLAANAPKNIGNLWINYTIPFHKNHYFSVGTGGNYVDMAYTDVYNRTEIPAYLLLNATAGYHFGQTQVGIRLNNLSNQKYYSGSGNPMPPRNYTASISFSF